MTRRRLFLLLFASWLAIVLMRLGALYAGPPQPMGLNWPQLIVVVSLAVLFWVPTALAVIAIDRSRVGKRTTGWMLAHVVFAIVAVALEPLWVNAVLAMMGVERMYLMVLIARLDSNFLLYAVIVAADATWLRFVALKEREEVAARLEQRLTDIQLHGLALQLQPHFLFNALQFVAETAHNNLAEARRTLELLRGLVEQAFALESRMEVTVAEELSFLKAYGAIQKSRFGDRFELTMTADDAALGGAIPPLLLQPLVENAARHGFGHRASGGKVEVTARTRNGVLSIVVADNGVGLANKGKEGQGMVVTRGRLARLYGADAHLSLVRGPDGRTEARIRLPLRSARPDLPPTGFTGEFAIPEPEMTVPVHNDLGARVPFGVRIIGVWVVLLTLLIGGTYLGLHWQIYWPKALPGLQALFLDEMVGVPFWVLLTVVAVLAARRFTGRWGIAAHIALAVTVALTHAFLGPSVARFLSNAPTETMRYVPWAPWDILVYTTLVLVARVHHLGAWVRGMVRDEVSLNEKVVGARDRLRHLREAQSVLLTELDDVIASPTMESLDSAVVGFADFLRVDVMAGVTK